MMADLPPHIQAKVQRILDDEARRILRERLEGKTEFIAELRRLSGEVGGKVCQRRGDVVMLALPDGREVCNEDGTFDIWTKGKMRDHSLDYDEAVALLRQPGRTRR